MQNELEVSKQFEIVITNEQKELVRRTIAPDATDSELALFFYDCTRRGVHPLDKLIHFTKRNGKYTPITSIDMFRQRASESGEHFGTDDAIYLGDASKPEFAASVTVYKKVQGEKCAFTATARWSEYFPGEKQGFMWQKMPHLMLAKCAEALALRKAFPAQLHGLYTPEEMAQAESPSRSTVPQVRPRNDATMVQPATDRYTGEPVVLRHDAALQRQEDGVEPALGESQPTLQTPATHDAPAPKKYPTHLDEPAPKPQSAAEFARQQADALPEDAYVDGILSNFQPYQGQRAFQKGAKPGVFDVEDGQGGIVMQGVKYFDPALDVSSGLKRVFYNTDSYKGRTQYNAIRIEALE